MIASKLHSKSAFMYHAVNLVDFKAYWREQAILSRSELSAIQPSYTKFFSDNKDKELGVWERTFGNLNDFGSYIAKYESAAPNAYGPITLVFNHAVWPTLKDIVVTKNTITSDTPHQMEESEIEEAYSQRDGRYWLNQGYKACEVSSSSSRIPFTHLAYILVDPLVVNSRSLRQLIWDEMDAWSAPNVKFRKSEKRLRQRIVKDSKLNDLYARLVSWSEKLKGRLLDDYEPLEKNVPENLREWLSKLDIWKKRVLASWLTYTYNGTIRLMN